MLPLREDLIFSTISIDALNSFPEFIVEAQLVNTFKKLLDQC